MRAGVFHLVASGFIRDFRGGYDLLGRLAARIYSGEVHRYLFPILKKSHA
jgi:hypothetical protein